MQEGNFKVLANTIKELQKYKKVLLLTCSNRGDEISKTELPKSSILAKIIHKNLKNSVILDVTKLKIYPCEGNVSLMGGNICGVKEALLDDTEKNPSGYHRCWASIHNEDDELWKISKELFESDCVVFFTSIRWGNANMFYQKLIERLNWINNRFIPGGEPNIIKDINSGFICVGQHHYADSVTKTQKGNHDYYGFKVNDDLYWYWMSEDLEYDEETYKGYLESYPEFYKDFKIIKKID